MTAAEDGPTSLDIAKSYLSSARGEKVGTIAQHRAGLASAAALVSIAESLDSIAERGIQTFRLDAEGHVVRETRGGY